MSKREKIIVGLMVVAVAYGVYTLFLSTPPRPAATVSGAKELVTLNAFITKVAEKAKTGFSKKQAYILQKAQAAWKQDPLIKIRPQKTADEKESGESPKLKAGILYTGVLQMGERRLAIINGMEYEAGDKLEPGGFIIRNILPNHVVIVPPGKKQKTMILPMEENE